MLIPAQGPDPGDSMHTEGWASVLGMLVIPALGCKER